MKCPECGAEMKLKYSKYGKFYGCAKYPKCRGSHGCHPNGEPLGIPANKETKEWRIKAHEAFDHWIRNNDLARAQAYKKMAKIMGIPCKQAHIAKFNINQC